MNTHKQIESHAGAYAFLLFFGTALLALFLLGVCQWCDKNTTYPKPTQDVYGNENGINQ